jgi:transglutaminase-like putative cysteine protease
MTTVKFEALKRLTIKDSTTPQLRFIADRLAECSMRRQETYVQLAFALAGRCISYQLDSERVGKEDIAGFTRPSRTTDALEALERGSDDCDAKARLFVALCLARGVRAQLMPVWRCRDGQLTFASTPEMPTDELAHVYGAVWMLGAWHWAETTLARACLGDHPLVVPKEKSGQWKNT